MTEYRYFHVPEYEIEAVCSYIKDDQTVANYFGIPRERVATVRGKMRTYKHWRYVGVRSESPDQAWGLNSHVVAADEAELGSRKLNAAYQRMFRKWEEEHGFQKGAAEILLPAGYVPENEREAA